VDFTELLHADTLVGFIRSSFANCFKYHEIQQTLGNVFSANAGTTCLDNRSVTDRIQVCVADMLTGVEDDLSVGRLQIVSLQDQDVNAAATLMGRSFCDTARHSLDEMRCALLPLQ
jgi:hypothetical protein